MKTLFKLFGYLLLLLVLAAGALFVNAWWFKPLAIDVFFETVFIKALVDDPETLSQLGLLEQYGINFHSDDLTDASPARGDRLAQLMRESLDTLHRYDRAQLGATQQTSYDVLDWYLQDQVEGQRWRYHDFPVNPLSGVQNEFPSFMATTHRIATDRDAVDYNQRLSKVGIKFDQALEGLRLRESKGVLPPKFVIEKVLAEMRAFVATPPQQNILYTALAKGLDSLKDLPPPLEAQLLADAQRQIESTVYPAYGRLIGYYESLLGRPLNNDGAWSLPDGDEYYAWAVRSHTSTTLTPEQVHRLGLSEVERINTEMDAILRAQGYTEGTVGARMQTLGAEPRFVYEDSDNGRTQCLADFQRIIDDIDRGLSPVFNVRPAIGVKVERVPVFKEKTAPGAYYNPPALDGTRPGIFYLNLRSVAEIPKFGMRTLAYHEAIPGHHFQIGVAQTLTEVPTFRRVLGFTAFAEGWALYAERLASELGYTRDPYDDLGRLQAEMFRAVRLVVDSGMHYKRWSREQAIDYMLDQTGMAEGDVVAEIERYLVWPGQALAYKVGMLKILQLRERARGELGAAFDLREFHDMVLKAGSLPMGVLEARIDGWIARRKSAV